MSQTSKTDELANAYLADFNGRLSGSAFKVVFQIVMRWLEVDTDDVRVTLEDLEYGTGLSRRTLIKAVEEASARRAVLRSRWRDGFRYRLEPDTLERLRGAISARCNIYTVQILHGANIAPLEVLEPLRLFGVWLEANGHPLREPSPAEVEIGRRILEQKSFEDCEKAIRGYASRGAFSLGEALADPATVERGIIIHEFKSSGGTA